MHNFKELIIWKKAIDLAVDVYSITKEFPNSEAYGLISQLRRCSVSISSNIAEGAGRNSNKAFLHYLNQASGSCCELETQFIIAQKLSFVSDNVFEEIMNRIQELHKLNYALRQTLNAKLTSP